VPLIRQKTGRLDEKRAERSKPSIDYLVLRVIPLAVFGTLSKLRTIPASIL
jgi:hypothetical protein